VTEANRETGHVENEKEKKKNLKGQEERRDALSKKLN